MAAVASTRPHPYVDIDSYARGEGATRSPRHSPSTPKPSVRQSSAGSDLPGPPNSLAPTRNNPTPASTMTSSANSLRTPPETRTSTITHDDSPLLHEIPSRQGPPIEPPPRSSSARPRASDEPEGVLHDIPEAEAFDAKDSAEPVTKRVVVDDPSVDIGRAEARELEAIPDPKRAAEPIPETTPRSRQDFSAQNAASASRRKEVRFGEYSLGHTLGEGEFGKVKLGWKKESRVQVAIKLIRRDSLGSNPSRLPKIHREINILEKLHHPNIVKLHEMVETPQYIGIILEYASGGELFDYILTHRYLRDTTARKLFAQLVSGVGYLHQQGIVHRDLKLENLLLDANRNMIITDFGFANTFDPNDRLTDDIVHNLADRQYVKRMDLDRVVHGNRRGDLMATSCGSPCYAAPELVVTDSLYTGRKVDVWSCGVILYAMLAGYLPFDDDPDNPDGDNINLLYKYITTTPLTFPEYVTPHARDLLRRILVPDPRERADLFEVARHSWLSDYAHVVAQVGSSVGESLPVRSRSMQEGMLTPSNATSPDLAAQAFPTGDESLAAKRRTVQVDHVESAASRKSPDPGAKSRGRAGTGPPEARPMPSENGKPQSQENRRRPITYQPPARQTRNTQRPVSTAQQAMSPPALHHDLPRSASDSTSAFGAVGARPSTGGSLGIMRLPSHGNSYAQPVAPAIASTNAHGHVSRPLSEIISHPIPVIDANPAPSLTQSKSHRRSSTIGQFFRSGSLSGSRPSILTTPTREKRYPPTSMKTPIAAEGTPRASTDSRRGSFSFGRKPSDLRRHPETRRFSLLPASFSFKSLTGERPATARTSNAETQTGLMDGPMEATNTVGSRSTRERTTRPYSAQYFASPQVIPHERFVTAEAQVSGEVRTLPNSTSQPLGHNPVYPPGFGDEARPTPRPRTGNRPARVLTKSHRRHEEGPVYVSNGLEGAQHVSTGPAKRVMDFFRRRGRSRGEEQV